MSLTSALAELKASLATGNEQFTTKHFRLLVQALEEISFSDVGEGNVATVRQLDFAGPTILTVASGVVTATQTVHQLDTEGGAATDDLDTINGAASSGFLLVLRATSGAREVVVKDGTGNLALAGDMVLDDVEDTLVLISRSSSAWVELCRSNNG